ncbi:transmembrane protein 256 homolog [Lycorma delicatula]|uniref:transmembrane protein 256 homolog n=1 Tax=Lycorma delicatula TaxID=130591 RepID=UPI003F50E6B9
MFPESMQWILQNPVVTQSTDVAKFMVRQLNTAVTSAASVITPKSQSVPTIVVMEPLPLWKLAGASSNFVRLAGLSGASAVALGAYGAHAKFDKGHDEKLRLMFETANKYHFIHTLALLGVPLCHYPKMTGSFLVLGMVMFCGTCYYRALTGNGNLKRITPIGGTLLIFAWLTMCF